MKTTKVELFSCHIQFLQETLLCNVKMGSLWEIYFLLSEIALLSPLFQGKHLSLAGLMGKRSSEEQGKIPAFSVSMTQSEWLFFPLLGHTVDYCFSCRFLLMDLQSNYIQLCIKRIKCVPGCTEHVFAWLFQSSVMSNVLKPFWVSKWTLLAKIALENEGICILLWCEMSKILKEITCYCSENIHIVHVMWQNT